MPVWRRSPERRPTSSCGCGTSSGSLAAVRRLAVQARLWKMAPDEMDSRYETLLRRCASTDKRLRVTTVSDVLAGISETLQDTVSRRLPARSPRFVPCDFVKDAPSDALVPLEEHITVDSSQEEHNHDNHGGVELQGQSPALITLVSPSTTSLSSAAEGRAQVDRDSPVGSIREADEKSFPHSKSPVRTHKSGANGSTAPRRREPRSRRLRRTPVSYYPQMSWRRAHQLVQTRQREARRRRSPYRPLEKNPGWTPLQKAIKRSGILTSPAAYDFVFPDSSSDASNAESDPQRRNNLHNERAHHYQETKSMPQKSRLQRGQQGGMVYGSSDVTSAERVARRGSSRDKTPPPRERTTPKTPEVIVTSRSAVDKHLSPLARSISVFSDSSSPRRGNRDDDHGIGSTSNDYDVHFGTPKGSSTPICSAMELFLNAEPFVPRLPSNPDESTLSSVHDPSLQNCLENTPCKFPIQETTAEKGARNASNDDHNGHESENNVAKPSKSHEISHTDEAKAKAARQDAKPAMQQQLIPVIENGVVIPRLTANEASKAADAATPAISKATASDAQRQIQGALRNIIPNGLVLSQSDRQCSGQRGLLPTPPPPGLGQGFVLLQNVAQLQHIQQQPPIGGLCGVQRQPQIAGIAQGLDVQQQQNGRTLPQGLLQQQVFQNGQQNGALIIPTIPGVNLQWQRQQQHYQQQQQQQQPQFHRQQQQRHLGDMNRPGGSQFQNNQRWEPQCQQQHPQQQQQIQAIQVQQLRQHQQQQLQSLQQQQQLNYQQQQQQQQQQRQQAAYRQQQLNTTGAGVPQNNIGTQQHAGFNNNNYGHHPRHHQQLQQPVRPKLPNHFNGGAGGIPMLNNRQQHMPANNRVGFNQPVWGH